MSRLTASAAVALVAVGGACTIDTDHDTSPRTEARRPPASTTTAGWYATPGDGPSTDTPQEGVAVRPADDPDGRATEVAIGYALASTTVTPDNGPAAWLDAVAPYTTPRYQAELEAPAASAQPRLEPTEATLAAIHPVAPVAARWRFEVILTLTTITGSDPEPRTFVLYVDVAETPAGPRVDAAQ